MAESDRPAKRVKTSTNDHKVRDAKKARYRAQMSWKGAGKGAGKGASGKGASGKTAFGNGGISASGFVSGDWGLLVTCDKGKEKRSLREIEGLIEEVWGFGDGDGEGVDMDDGRGNRVGIEGDEETRNAGGGGSEESSGTIGTIGAAGTTSAARNENGIEDDIERELRELRGETTNTANENENDGFRSTGQNPSTSSSSANLGLVTLDIPCVSFVRLPQSQPVSNDPVQLVYEICRQAYQDPTRQKSRFIKRITPVQKVRKIMGGGLERLCDEVLPGVFGLEHGPPSARDVGGKGVDGDGEEGEVGEKKRDEERGEAKKGWKYAVRVTVRNNNQVSRDEIIKVVASYVSRLGRGETGTGKVDLDEQGNTSSEDEGAGAGGDNGEEQVATMNTVTEPTHSPSTRTSIDAITGDIPSKPPLEHKVDLKNYEKLVLVEVYRNVVGMSVVGEAREYEDQLRRFNLSEIYAEGRKRVDAAGEDAVKVESGGAVVET